MPGSLASTELINSKVGESLFLLLPRNSTRKKNKIRQLGSFFDERRERVVRTGQILSVCLITTQSIQSSRQNRPSPSLPFESIQDEIDLVKAESVDRS